LDLTLAARPSMQERANPPARGVQLGILGTTVDEAIATEMNLPNGQQGVLVEQVEPGSLAEAAGLHGGDRTVTLNGRQVEAGGDVIVAVNEQSIASIEELKAALAQLISSQDLTLTILRNGAQMEITIQPGP
jgi:serine protease Do